MANTASRTTGGPLSSAMNASRFVVAGEYGGEVYVYSTPITTCTAIPVMTLLGVITGGKEPGVSIDEAGRVWVATVTTAGGIALSSF